MAVYVTVILGVIVLIGGCRESGGETPQPSPGPAVVTPDD